MQAAARLHHPNIAVVYDVGEKDGTLYFVMEYLEGTSLDKLILETGFKVRLHRFIARIVRAILGRQNKFRIQQIGGPGG
jgi:serine/threonine protein kinase